MRRVLVAALLVASLGGLVLAEGEPQPTGFGGSGMFVGLLPLDFSPLNAVLSAAGYPSVEGPVVVFGGGGAGGILGEVAFGGLGFGGSLTTLAAGRRTDIELGFGGMVIEHPRQVAEGAVLGFGAVLGGGSLDLTTWARQPEDFADSLATPPMSHFGLGFFGGLAYLRVQIQLAPWLAIEGWGGYFLAFSGQWEAGGREISGPQLGLRAPFFGLGIVFGGVVEEGEEPVEIPR